MKKTIEVGGISCTFRSSAAIPRIYRMKFGRDIFVDISNLGKQMEASKNDEEGSSLPIQSLETFENIAYIMHKHGDSSQPDNIDEWLEQFETFDIYKVLPEILTMWNLEKKSTSVAKKKTEK